MHDKVEDTDWEGCCKFCRVSSSSICFPGDSQLALDNGQFVKMKDLKVGQRILTGKLVLLYIYIIYLFICLFD